MTAALHADLVKRLRASGGKGQYGRVRWEAADAIDSLERQLARSDAVVVRAEVGPRGIRSGSLDRIRDALAALDNATPESEGKG